MKIFYDLNENMIHFYSDNYFIDIIKREPFVIDISDSIINEGDNSWVIQNLRSVKVSRCETNIKCKFINWVVG